MPSSKEIKNILDFDPLDAAEKITGKSYKSSNSTIFIGMSLSSVNARKKEAMLKKLGDTYHGINFEKYVSIVEAYGFERIYEDQIERKYGDNIDTFYVYFHKEKGIVLKFDSYGDVINSSSFFFQHLTKNMWLSCYSSGGLLQENNQVRLFDYGTEEVTYPIECPNYDDYKNNFYKWIEVDNKWMAGKKKYMEENDLNYIFSGHNDGCEGLIFQIEEIEKNGDFVKHWINDGRLETLRIYLHDYDSGKEWEDKNSIANKRISSFPDYVKEQIGLTSLDTV